MCMNVELLPNPIHLYLSTFLYIKKYKIIIKTTGKYKCLRIMYL